MTNKPKTPGEVAYEAYHSWRPDMEARSAWAAAAHAVRVQLRRELDAEVGIVAAEPGKVMKLIGEIAVEDIVRVAAIRKVLAEWSSNPAKVMSKWVYFSANDVIEAIEDLLALPTPEEAEGCAEGCAEPSPSPPPAER